ncbi:MAG: (2Fe-2S)-binding protein, partial [Proteobacteria bacterium]|nr:(2Fe-2S)-binding protein [Pseudomonadota bacterium]
MAVRWGAVAQFVRLSETGRPRVNIVLDGRPISAMSGDTMLTAILTNVGYVRHSEFGDGPRGGFCLMGACQDCWVWLSDGTRIRACT